MHDEPDLTTEEPTPDPESSYVTGCAGFAALVVGVTCLLAACDAVGDVQALQGCGNVLAIF
jgi:hypothetical protein